MPFYLESENEIIDNCEDELKKELSKLPRMRTKKNYKNYNRLSQDFLEYEKLIKVQNSSFQVFLSKLPKNI